MKRRCSAKTKDIQSKSRGGLWAVTGAGLLFLLLTAYPARAVTIGIINDEPLCTIERFEPLVRYIERHIQPEPGEISRVIVTRTLREMAEYLKSGRVDFFIDTPFPAMLMNHLSGSRFLLRRWKKGEARYHTVIFCRRDDGIKRLEDLNGKTIAFEDLSSSSSYMLPKMVLQQKGFALTHLPHVLDQPDQDHIGYVFSGHDENTMIWVLKKQVDAGAMNALAFRDEVRKQVSDVRVIYRTASIPRDLVCVRGDYPPQKAEAVKNCLIGMEQTVAGRHILAHLQKTTRFDEIPKKDLDYLKQLLPFIMAELDAQ